MNICVWTTEVDRPTDKPLVLLKHNFAEMKKTKKTSTT